MVAAVLWLFVLVLLTVALGGLWGDYLDNKIVRFVLAPGFLAVLVLKHVACVCASAKAKESRPFGPGDEVLTHADPRLPGGHLVVAALPFFGMVAVFGIATHFLAYHGDLRKIPALPYFPESLGGVGGFFTDLGRYFGGMFNTLWRLVAHGGGGAIALYLGVCAVFALRPCYRDVKYLCITVAVLAGIGMLCEFLGIGFTRRTAGNRDLFDWGAVIMWNLSLLIGLAIALLLVSGATIGVARLAGWGKAGHERERERKREEG
jgi:hypothetical protein